MSLYEEDLVSLADRAYAIPAAAKVGEAHNPLCGDVTKLGVVVVDGRVESVGVEVQGCLVCRASAALLVETLRGAEMSECSVRLAELESRLAKRDAGAGRFAVFRRLHAYPSRHVCALLPWRALEDALHEERPRAVPEHSVLPPRALNADVWSQIEDIRADGDDAALVTLVRVGGSSPCPLGSRMVVASSGEFWGSVSGGCVESAVAQAAIQLLGASNPPSFSRLLTFRIANSQAGEVGLPCGGEIQVHITRAPGAEDIGRIRTATRIGSARILDLESGAWEIAQRGHDASRTPDVIEAIEAVLSGADAIGVPGPSSQQFVEALRPPPRLILVGGTHIAQMLAVLAVEVGFRPVLVDPRSAFANAKRFGSIELHVGAPKDVLPALIDSRSALVVLSHNPNIDDPSLSVGLRSEAFYVGALGSRKTQRERLLRLRVTGLSETELARLHGPAGVPIGGQGAAEIALSILAEVVATRRRRAAPRRVGAVVLAAGTSSRAGTENKLLADIEGKVMVRRVVEATLDAEVFPVVVVLGHEASRVRRALDGLNVVWVHNENYSSGMGSSIAAGVRAIRAQVDATLVVLGDMPFVRPKDIRLLVAAHQSSTQHLIIAPESGAADERRLGNPVLWPERYFDALQRLDGDAGGKVLIQGAPGAVLRIPIDDEGVLRDVDRPEAAITR
ncbi:MAG: NTP transferase domain-containing protein [Polyangiales bacterium]